MQAMQACPSRKAHRAIELPGREVVETTLKDPWKNWMKMVHNIISWLITKKKSSSELTYKTARMSTSQQILDL